MRHTLLYILLLATLPTFAAERTEAELHAIAARVLGCETVTRGGEQLRTLEKRGGLVVVGSETRGFCVLATDDSHEAVLGYSACAFPKSNPELQWWIDCTERAMEREASASRESDAREADTSRSTRGNSTRASDITHNAVAPFITTHWDQSSPYNDLCPSYTASGATKRYPTGCLATAMAQAMNYCRWPDCGTGSHKYRFNPGDGTQQIVTVTLDDMPLSWDLMLPSYPSGGYTDEQAQAVATLMYACGASTEMQYTADGSGALMTDGCKALRRSFKYDAGMPLHMRDYESAAEFTAGIYAAIERRQPVVFGGQSSSGGHAFVLDGCDEAGLVHVNWGWGSRGGDGFFDLSYMNGYKDGQQYCALSRDGTYPAYVSRMTLLDDGLTVRQVSDTNIGISAGAPVNVDAETYTGDIYVVAQDLATGTAVTLATQTLSSPVAAYSYAIANGGTISKPNVTLRNKGVGDGSHRVFLATKSATETAFSPLRTADGLTNSWTMTVAGGKITSLAADEDNAWMTTTAINAVREAAINAVREADASRSSYTVSGQRATPATRGIIIKGGRKSLRH